ncbi:M23 family metallopeptidase [Agrococcus pavilionensis]|nr:M23 family metallopeptidase [Agrococcus pavilionensis]
MTEGSPPIYTTRRSMREDATRKAQQLEVTLAAAGPSAATLTVDAPALGSGGEHVPRRRAQEPPRSGPPSRTARPPRKAERVARRVARKVTAAASLLFIGSLLVVTSLPAQAVQVPNGLDPAIAQLEPEAQSLGTVAAEPSALLARDDVAVRDPLASARLTPAELAELQAVADSERPGPAYGGQPAFPRVWSMLDTGFVQTPFPGVAQMPISSGFGFRPGGFHGGTDIPFPPGQEIRPIANGVVSAVYQGDTPGGGGYAVWIDHNINGQFVQSWYPHMTAGSIRVEVGQVVDINTVVGQVGSTGRSTGPHLHLELKNSDYVSFDPILWLKSREMDLESRY